MKSLRDDIRLHRIVVADFIAPLLIEEIIKNAPHMRVILNGEHA